MYKQNLYSIHTNHLEDKKIKNKNRYKKFKPGYNEELDCVVISKDGTIGDIYEIQNLKIALPKAKNIHKFKNKKWSKFEYPKVLSKIKSVFDFKQYPEDFKDRWYD